jgi:3-methyl-2-oxobutanoate hydroxymethyltransferase
MVIVDMPFGSYQGDPYVALQNAVCIMKETGADGLKLEGGVRISEAIKLIINAGIPVVGHLGLTPQSVHQFGGFGLRAKEDAEAEQLLSDAQLLAELGVCALVLEKVPASLAQKVSEMIAVPVIGIGAGADVDGQVLVLQDMLGMDESFRPKFVRRFAMLGEQITAGISSYVSAVKDKSFPSQDESY